MNVDEQLTLVSQHLNAEMSLDLDGVLATLVSDPFYVLWDGSELRGLKVVQGFYERLFKRLYPDMRVPESSLNIWVGESGVVAEGPVALERDGSLSTFHQISVVHFEGDLIKGERMYADSGFAAILDGALEGWRGD
jgi:hypothetical protein